MADDTRSQDFKDGIKDYMNGDVAHRGGMFSDLFDALTFNTLNTDKSDDYYAGAKWAEENLNRDDK